MVTIAKTEHRGIIKIGQTLSRVSYCLDSVLDVTTTALVISCLIIGRMAQQTKVIKVVRAARSSRPTSPQWLHVCGARRYWTIMLQCSLISSGRHGARPSTRRALVRANAEKHAPHRSVRVSFMVHSTSINFSARGLVHWDCPPIFVLLCTPCE